MNPECPLVGPSTASSAPNANRRQHELCGQERVRQMQTSRDHGRTHISPPSPMLGGHNHVTNPGSPTRDCRKFHDCAPEEGVRRDQRGGTRGMGGADIGVSRPLHLPLWVRRSAGRVRVPPVVQRVQTASGHQHNFRVRHPNPPPLRRDHCRGLQRRTAGAPAGPTPTTEDSPIALLVEPPNGAQASVRRDAVLAGHGLFDVDTTWKRLCRAHPASRSEPL